MMIKMEAEKFSYDNNIVRNFAYATVIWGVTGMLVGLIAALQLAFPEFFNDYLGFSFLSFGRIRPLHTNAVIFAFVGNGLFMGVYYSLQRLLKTRMWSDKLSNLHFWGWQFIIVCAVATLPFGYTSGKEYAELEWWLEYVRNNPCSKSKTPLRCHLVLHCHFRYRCDVAHIQFV